MDLHSIFLNDSLYTEYDIKSLTDEELLSILLYNEQSNGKQIKTLDSYCPICEKHTTFISDEITTRNFIEINSMKDEQLLGVEHDINSFFENCGTFERRFKCPRPGSDGNHDHIYLFRVKNGKLIKIGQSPSLADLTKDDIEKYRSLNENIYRELNRAIGLSSHGIGVGSFVYLRRIVEKHIVAPILNELINTTRISKQEVLQADFKTKIDLAKDALPEFLVNNKKIYSILSRGIHELEEKECNELFPVLRTAIEIILDEKIDKKVREMKTKLISEELKRIK